MLADPEPQANDPLLPRGERGERPCDGIGALGFLALLGAMSLSGMMIKNSIVLIDQINQNKAEGLPPYDSVVEAAVSRLRPVVLAAAIIMDLQTLVSRELHPAAPAVVTTGMSGARGAMSAREATSSARGACICSLWAARSTLSQRQ
mgnify:CR=1 FL=1